MKTNYVITLLVILLQLAVMGQSKQNVLDPRVQKAGPNPKAAYAGEASSIMGINQKIENYNKQLAALRATKNEIDAEINNFFEGEMSGLKNKLNVPTEEDLKVEIAMLEALSLKYKNDFHNNKEIIKQLLFEVANSSEISEDVIFAMENFNHLMKEGDDMRAEAYLSDEKAACAGILSNAVEKEQLAVRGQRKVIGLLENKEETTALYLNK